MTVRELRDLLDHFIGKGSGEDTIAVRRREIVNVPGHSPIDVLFAHRIGYGAIQNMGVLFLVVTSEDTDKTEREIIELFGKKDGGGID